MRSCEGFPDSRGNLGRVELASLPCKGERFSTTRPGGLLCAVVIALPLSACSAPPRRTAITLEQIETAPAMIPASPRRFLIADPTPLRRLIQPLGRRIGLLEIRTPAEWSLLQHAAPDVGDCPDLADGVFVGLVSEIGEPLDRNAWPLSIDSIQCAGGAALLSAAFHTGSYLPDGAMYVTAISATDVAAVVIVEINGVRLYPE